MFLVCIPVLYSGFELGNTDYSSFVSYKVFIAVLFVLLMLASFGTYFILRKRFLLHFVVGFSALSLAFSFGFLGFTQMYNKHLYEGEYSQKYTLENFSGSTLALENYGFDLYGNTYALRGMFGYESVDYAVSETDQYMVEVHSRILTDSDASTQYFGKRFSDLEVYDVR